MVTVRGAAVSEPFPEAVVILAQDWLLRAYQSVAEVIEKVFRSPSAATSAEVGSTLSGAPTGSTGFSRQAHTRAAKDAARSV